MIRRTIQSLIVALIFLCGSTYADEVPFMEHLISDNFKSPEFSYPADIDEDGDIDVVVVSRIGGKIAWFDNNGGSPPTFTERNVGTSYDARGVFVADVNGDGDPDIITTSALGSQEVIWWESDGAVPPNFSKHTIPVNGDDWYPVFATDLDDDGDIDVLVGNGPSGAYANRVLWLENNGSSSPSFTERVISSAVNWPYSIFATDLDDDGDIDVLSASRWDDKIAWYENDGGSPPGFTQRIISTNADDAQHVYAADVDADGNIDVLGASAGDDKIAWYKNDGNIPPTFSEQIITSTPGGYGANFAFPTDVDNDGDTDVLATHWLADELAWYENDGGISPTFTEWIIASPDCPPQYAAPCFGPKTIYGGYDVDNDGDADVLALMGANDPVEDPGGKLLWYETISNQPPEAICQDVTVSTEPGLCMADASVDDGSFDPDGDDITLDQEPEGPYDLGDTDVTLTVTDDKGASGTCDATVTVVDEEAPVISSVTASPNKLWPPNHKMVPVTVAVDATDNCDFACQIISVASNEPVNGLGDGNTTPDWVITGDLTVNLRAERSGTGSGRIYTITVECSDSSGNSSTDTATVTVPHDKGKKNNQNNKKKK